MELANSRNKVELSGLEFDNPLDSLPLAKREYREFKDGVRTTIKEIWLDRYIYGDKSVHIERSCLQMTNRGVCTLDERQLKDKTDIDKVKYIFENLKVAER